jgi:hypothetical protein
MASGWKYAVLVSAILASGYLARSAVAQSSAGAWMIVAGPNVLGNPTGAWKLNGSTGETWYCVVRKDYPECYKER